MTASAPATSTSPASWLQLAGRRSASLLGAILLAAVLAVGLTAVAASPVSKTLAPQLAAQDASAFCATQIKLSGYLSGTAASGAAMKATSSVGEVYGYITAHTTNWSCNAFERYSGIVWNTSATLGTYDWGLLTTSETAACQYGTVDVESNPAIIHANATTTCPSNFGNALQVSLTDNLSYQMDSAHNTIGDFSYVATSCSASYGAEVVKSGTNAAAPGSNSWPGASCDVPELDSTNTTQSFKIDTIAPPAPGYNTNNPANTYLAGPGSPIYFRNTVAGSFSLTSVGTDTLSGATSNTFSALSATTGWTHTAGTVSGASSAKTLSWAIGAVSSSLTLTTTDVAGNTGAATTVSIIADNLGPGINFSAPAAATTKVATAPGGTVVVSDAGVGTNSFTIYRDKAPLANNTCGTFVADTAESADGSFFGLGGDYSGSFGDAVPYSAVGTGACYRYRIIATDLVGNTSTVTYNSIKYDPTAPNAPTITDNTSGLAWAYRSANTIFFNPTTCSGGILTLTSDGTDDETAIGSSTFPAAPASWTPGGSTNVAGDPAAKSLTCFSTSVGGTMAITSTDSATNVGPGTTITLTADPNSPTPTVFTAPASNIIQSTTSYTFAWNASTDASGVQYYQRVLQWADISATPGVCDTVWANQIDHGTSTATSITEPTGGTGIYTPYCWREAVRPIDNVGNGATWYYSPSVLVDTTAAGTGTGSVTIGDDDATNDKTFRAGATLWFRATVGGTTALTVTGADPQSGIGSVNFNALGGTTTGWSPLTALNGQANGASRTYTWTTAATGFATFVGTALNGASQSGSSASLNLSPDAGIPVATFTGTVAGNTLQTALTATISWTERSETSESGLASRSTQRQIASIPTPGTCAGASWVNDGAAVTSTTGFASTLATGNCYRFLTTLTDNVGNTSTTTSGWILVDSSAPAAPTLSVGAAAGSFVSGSTIYFRPSAASTITVTSTGTDAESGIASSTFGALSAPTGWTYTAGTVAGNPAAKDLTWSASAGDTSIAATTTNGTGLTSASSSALNFVADASVPSVVTGVPAGFSFGSQTSYSLTFTFSEVGSGLAGSWSAQRQSAAPTGGVCPAPATFVNSGSAVTGTSLSPQSNAQTLVNGTCYLWVMTATDKVGNALSHTTGIILVDTTAPVTTATPTGTAGTNGWFTSATVSVALAATDTSGIASTSYEIDGGSTVTYAGAFVVSGQGTHVVTYRSTDGAGNVEATKSLTVKIDSVAPSGAATYPAAGLAFTNNGSVSVTWTESDATSGIAGRVNQRQFIAVSVPGACGTPTDNGSPVGTASPRVYALTANGCYRWTTTITDLAGNSTVVTSGKLILDDVAPVTTPSATGTNGANGWFTSSSATLTLSASDATAGVTSTTYEINGGATQTYSGAFAINSDGHHIITYRSTDAAGNAESTGTFDVKIDSTNPSVSFSAPVGSVIQGGDTYDVSWSASDTASGIAGQSLQRQTSIPTLGVCPASGWSDDGAANSASSPVHETSLVPGSCYRWIQNATDTSGRSTSVTSGTVLMDSAAPDVAFTAPTSDSTQATTGVTVSWTEFSLVGISGRSLQRQVSPLSGPGSCAGTWTNSGAAVTSASPSSQTLPTSDRCYHWVLTVTDTLSRSSEATSAVITYDATPPVTTAQTFGTTGANGWHTGATTVALTATDASSAVASTSYRIDGGTLTTYSGSFAVTGEGTHSVTYSSVDALGNAESTNTLAVKIDSIAPTTSATPTGTAGANGWFKSAVTMTLSATDATSGVAATSYEIDGGATVAYSGAFAVSGAGSHEVTYRSTDAAGLVESTNTITVKIDSTAPATSASAAGTAGLNGWYLTAVSVTLVATDATSGVATTTYKIDGGTTQTYSSAFSVSTAGTHTVTYNSTDAAGNVESTNSLTVKIDSADPVTTAVATGTAGTGGWFTSPTVSVTLSATDATAGVAGTTYEVDGGTTQAYSGAFNVSGEGTHAVTYRSTDNAGQTETTKTLTVKIDTIKPATVASITGGTLGDNGWYTSNVTVTLVGSDATSGVGSVKYTLNGGVLKTYTAPFAVSTQGVTNVAFWSIDVAGNTETAGALIFQLDSVLPTSAIGSMTTPVGSPNLSIPYSASDATSGLAGVDLYAKLNGSASGNSGYTNVGTFTSSPISWTAPSDGVWHLYLRAADVAGNSEAAPTNSERDITVDTTAPLTTLSKTCTLGNNGYCKTNPTVTLTTTDATATVITYRVDGGAWTTYAGPFLVTGEGNHPIEFYGTDAVSNVETTKNVAVSVDTTAPGTIAEISGTQFPDSDVYGTAVVVSLNGSDDTSGVASITYKVDGAASATTYTGAFVVAGTTTLTTHTVTWTTTDFAGNTSTGSTSFDINLQTTTVSGTINCAHPGANGWCLSAASLSLTATDPLFEVTGLTYQIGTGTLQAYSGPISFASTGTFVVTYTATNNQGIDATGTTTVKIDRNNPTSVFKATGTGTGNGWFRGTVTVSLTLSDTGAGSPTATYSLDAGPTTAYTGAFTISTQGNHNVSWTVTDAAGRVLSGSNFVNVDLSVPTSTIGAFPATSSSAVLVLPITFSDAFGTVTSVQIYTSTSSSATTSTYTAGPIYPVTAATTSIQYIAPADGSIYMFIRATDKAGNVQAIPSARQAFTSVATNNPIAGTPSVTTSVDTVNKRLLMAVSTTPVSGGTTPYKTYTWYIKKPVPGSAAVKIVDLTTASGDISTTCTTALPGSQIYYIVKDTANRTATSEWIPLTSVCPSNLASLTPYISDPTKGTSLKSGSTQEFTVELFGGNGTYKVTWYVKSIKQGATVTTTASSNSAVLTMPVVTVTTNVTVSATVADTAGHISSTSVVVSVYP